MAEGGKNDAKKDKGGDAEQATNKVARRKVLLLGGLLLLILVAGGGGAAWYFLGKPKDETADAAADKADKAAKPKTFSSLDTFVVNLADDNGERMVQAGVVLEVSDPKVAADLTAQMPAVRNAILLLLSSKRSDEILTLAGKQALASEIAMVSGMALGWRPAPPEPAPAPKKVKAVADDDKRTDGEPRAKPRDGDDATADASDDEGSDVVKAARAKALAKAPRKAHPPNPIEGVHFSQFLVQ
jgi:flagellar FliL protein